MDVSLSEDQRGLLLSILQDTLGGVREEVVKSEQSDYREALKQKEVLVRDLLAALGGPAT
jgi:hypothetical protein